MTTLDPKLANTLYPQQQRPMNYTLGPNRYIPPTFNYGRNGERRDFNTMDWNTMQQFYMPQQNNDTLTAPYMSNLMNMLQQYQGQYGSFNRQPSMPFQGQRPFGNNGQQYQGMDFNRMLMMQMLGGMPQQQMFPQSYSNLFGFGQQQAPGYTQTIQQIAGTNPSGIPGGK